MESVCKINRLTVSGFRGIPNQLDIIMSQNGTPRSAVVFGENGTGKSSLVDAWEWFRYGKIEHLAREGAKEQAYPHLLAHDGAIFAEVEFADTALNTLRLTFDRSRVTQPTETGNFPKLRQVVQAPCHLRFGDLTRFVYFTKTERFDALASLMGFVPQVEYQKALRRVENRLEAEIEKSQAIIDDLEKTLATAAGVESISEATLMSVVANNVSKAGVKCDATPEAIQSKLLEIQETITKDPAAKRLAGLKAVKEALTRAGLHRFTIDDLRGYHNSLVPFKDRAEDIANILLLDLYNAGEAVIMQTGKSDFCPLCQRAYDGNLLQHIQEHALILAELKKTITNLESKRNQILTNIGASSKYEPYLKELGESSAWTNSQLEDSILMPDGRPIDQATSLLNSLIQTGLSEIDAAHIGEINTAITRLHTELTEFGNKVHEAEEEIQGLIDGLEVDKGRTLLVETHSTAKKLLGDWISLSERHRAITSLSKIKSSYATLVEEYVSASTSDVDNRFQRISTKVKDYFGVLEADTTGIGSPALRLLTDQDRSVVLEVSFHGQTIQPAYKFLSESQLNSFGLSVFLASAREFNPDFTFLILDDVINSFDAYKRPQVIRLLNTYFVDFQVLILTHDQIWRDQLYRAFPNWLKREFYDFSHQVGPCIRDGLTTVERVTQLCTENRAEEAGGVLGRYLELRLQELCECFGASVKFRRRNDFTLDTLLDRFRERVEQKLGTAHTVSSLLSQVSADSVFRNFCAHWKAPTTPYTRQEIEGHLDAWLAVENAVYCGKPRCREALRYDETNRGFRCPCGHTSLSRP